MPGLYFLPYPGAQKDNTSIAFIWKPVNISYEDHLIKNVVLFCSFWTLEGTKAKGVS